MPQVFSCEFCDFSKNTSYAEHFWTTASIFTTSKNIFLEYSEYFLEYFLEFF